MHNSGELKRLRTKTKYQQATKVVLAKIFLTTSFAALPLKYSQRLLTNHKQITDSQQCLGSH